MSEDVARVLTVASFVWLLILGILGLKAVGAFWSMSLPVLHLRPIRHCAVNMMIRMCPIRPHTQLLHIIQEYPGPVNPVCFWCISAHTYLYLCLHRKLSSSTYFSATYRQATTIGNCCWKVFAKSNYRGRSYTITGGRTLNQIQVGSAIKMAC